MKKRITFALIIIMVAALFAPALPAYAGTNASDIEAQIAKAERELEEAKAEQEAKSDAEVLDMLDGKKYERCLGQVGLSELTFSKSGSEYVISVTKGDRNGPGGVDKGLVTASITGLKQIDEYTYSFDTKDTKDEYSAHDELTEDGLTIHYLEIADWIDGTWNIYVPGTPVSMIPAPLWTGWHKDDAGTASMLEQWQENGVTKCYVLYHPDDREEAAYVESE